MTSSIYESIRLPTGLFPKKPRTNENLRHTNLLINTEVTKSQRNRRRQRRHQIFQKNFVFKAWKINAM